MRLTDQHVGQICRELNLYTTPSLNDNLYLNFRGITHLSGLKAYTGLKSLFLEGNALTSLDSLPPLPQLCCLFVQNNALTTLQHLPSTLHTLNIAANQLSTLDGISTCLNLSTVTALANKLQNPESLQDLVQCGKLESLDLQDNELGDIDSVLLVLEPLRELRCLYLKGNPGVTTASNYRKKVIARFPKLVYLDDRPIGGDERVCVEAWARGGIEAERAQQHACMEEKRNRIRRDVEALQEIKAAAAAAREEVVQGNVSEVSELQLAGGMTQDDDE